MGGSCSKCYECWAVCFWAKILTPETDCQHYADMGECKQASAGFNDLFGLDEYAGVTIPDILSNATKVKEISAYVNENFWSDSNLLSSTTPNMDSVHLSMRLDTMCAFGMVIFVGGFILCLLDFMYLLKIRAPLSLEYDVVYAAEASSRHSLPASVEKLEK